MSKETFFEFIKRKFFSRKMLVWVTATVLLITKTITQDIWLTLSIAYIGVNASLAAIEVIKMRRGPQDALPDEGAIAATQTEKTAEKDAAALRG